MIKKNLTVLAWCIASVMQAQDIQDASTPYQESVEQVMRGVVSSNNFYSQVITPSDLTCYPYEITKPGHYILTRDFKQVLDVNRNSMPLIVVRSSNVCIDLQGFMLYTDELGSTDAQEFLQSNLIDIGTPLQPVHNVTIKNGTLSSAAGFGIQIWNNCSSIVLEDLKILQSAIVGIGILYGSDVLIKNCAIEQVGYYAHLQSLYATFMNTYMPTYPLYVEDNMGPVGIFAVGCTQLCIQDSKISNNGALDIDYHTYGLFVHGGSNISVQNSEISNNYAGKVVYPVRCRFASDIEMKDCAISSNRGSGMQAVSLLYCSSVIMQNNRLLFNSASGAFAVAADVFNGLTNSNAVPLYMFDDSDLSWSFVGYVNTAQAYADFKEAVAYIKASYEDLSYLDANNHALVSMWNQCMQSLHAIERTLRYYSWLSQAYAVRCVHSSYIHMIENTILDTFATHNSAFGVMLDACWNVYVKNNTINGTQAWNNESIPTFNSDVQDALITFFGDILDGDNLLNGGETVAMLARSVGLEIRNATHSVTVDECLFKNNCSDWVFAAGVFFNRSIKSRLSDSWLEMNIGKDFGYGVLDCFVNPTDVVNHCTFYANGYDTDRNRNWGMQWSSTGKFSSKHVYPGDLDLANNVGPYENLEILFDGLTEPNLDFAMSGSDIADAYYVNP